MGCILNALQTIIGKSVSLTLFTLWQIWKYMGKHPVSGIQGMHSLSRKGITSHFLKTAELWSTAEHIFSCIWLTSTQSLVTWSHILMQHIDNLFQPVVCSQSKTSKTKQLCKLQTFFIRKTQSVNLTLFYSNFDEIWPDILIHHSKLIVVLQLVICIHSGIED